MLPTNVQLLLFSLVHITIVPITCLDLGAPMASLMGSAAPTLPSFPKPKSGSSSNFCSRVKCQEPPQNSGCKIVPESDHSLSRPRGKMERCCPLWKCKGKNQPPGSFFTFHGVDGGGTETMNYNSPLGNIVSDVATGSHDANAFATTGGEDAKNMENAMAEMQREFRKFFG